MVGGPGSSRWGMTLTRLTIEGLLRLDVRVLARSGALKPGAASSVTWGNGPAVTLSVSIRDTNEVHLVYEVQAHLDGMVSVRERIRLTRTPCTLDGSRVWFACPGCGTRCAVLYALGGVFRCRSCQHLTYANARSGLN